jgi:opacity protein-like surface antigen
VKTEATKTSMTSTWLHPLLVALLSLTMVGSALLVPQEAQAESHAQRYAKQERANKKKARAARKSSRSAKKTSKKTSKKKTTKASRKKVVKKKRVVRRERVRRTRTTTTRRSRVRRGRTYYYTSGPAPTQRATYVRNDPQPRTTTVARSRRNDGPYLGVGVGALAVDPSSQQAGGGVGLSLGVRSENLSLELGLLGGSQPVSRPVGDGTITQEMSLGGFSGDLKVYLPLGNQVEPYLQGGLGYYSVTFDGVETYAPAFNLGGGLDFRISRSFALGGRYLYHGYLEEVPTEVGPTSDAWSLMGTATIYF